MTPEQIEKQFKKLKKQICCISSTVTIDLSSLSVSNGLNLVGTVLKLGGTLTADTSIPTSTFQLSLSGSKTGTTSAGGVINVTNALAAAITGNTTSGNALMGFASTSGTGVFGSSVSGNGFYGTSKSNTLSAARFDTITVADTNNILRVLGVGRFTDGTAANNIGGGIDFLIQTASGSTTVTNRVISQWADATGLTSKLTITGVNATSAVDKIYIGGAATQINATRFETYKGANVASANDLTLGTDGNLFHITGTTTINAITVANWQAGSEVTLIFDGSVTVKNNTAGSGGTAVMLLAGGADFSATANDTLKLVYDGTSWFELSRSVN